MYRAATQTPAAAAAPESEYTDDQEGEEGYGEEGYGEEDYGEEEGYGEEEYEGEEGMEAGGEEESQQSAADTKAAQQRAEQLEMAERAEELAVKKRDHRLISFHSAHNDLMDVCFAVLRIKFADEASRGIHPPIAVAAGKYRQTYVEVDKPQNFMSYYDDIYERKSSFIHGTTRPGGDQWIKDRCIIQIGAGKKNISPDDYKGYYLNIGEIYKYAIELHLAEATIQNSKPEELREIRMELIFFKIIQLQLLRIYYHLQTDKEGQKHIAPMVQSLEHSLGIESAKRTVNREPWRSMVNKDGDIIKGGLSGLFQTTVSQLKNTGLGGEEDDGMTEENLAATGQRIFGNSQMLNVLQAAISGAQSGDDPGKLLMGVMEKTMDPAILSTILRGADGEQDDQDAEVAAREQEEAQKVMSSFRSAMGQE